LTAIGLQVDEIKSNRRVSSWQRVRHKNVGEKGRDTGKKG